MMKTQTQSDQPSAGGRDGVTCSPTDASSNNPPERTRKIWWRKETRTCEEPPVFVL